MKIFYFVIIFSFQIHNIFGKDNLIKTEEFFSSETDYSRLIEIINKYKDQLAVSVVPIKNDHTPFYFNKSAAFVSASMIKLLILCEFIDQIDHKKITLDMNYTYKEEDKVGGAGVIQAMKFGTILTYDTLAFYMIKYSDNIATNVLIDILGMDNINKKSKDLNLNETVLNRKMMNPGPENYMNAEDIEYILKGIFYKYKEIGSAAMCDRAMTYLKENDDYDAIVRGLPEGTIFAHKSGSLTKIRHDGGIVITNNKYIIIILTKGFANEEDANKLMGNISKIVYEIINDLETDNYHYFIKFSLFSIFLFLVMLF